MGNLNETANWEPGVPYFAADAILTGGPDCPDNIPIQALTNRTAFLKKQIDDAVSGALVTMTAKKLQTARTITMTGDGAWVVSFDGSGNATAAMALAATGVAAGTYPVVTVDSKGRVTGGRALTAADVPAVDVSKITGAASQTYVQQAIANLLNGAPGALDTLQELAAALGNDANFAATMTNALAGKVSLAQIQTQDGKAFQAGGASPAYTLTPSPAIQAYASPQRFNVTFPTTGTTGSNTINVSGLGAIPLKQYAADGTLVSGIVTAGMNSDVLIVGAGSYALLMDPLPAQAAQQLPGFTAGVAGNAMTGTLTPTGAAVQFRNSVLGNGTPLSWTQAAALSLTIPAGATLGSTNGQQSTLVWALVYNGGNPALAVANFTYGIDMSETGLISTTAISSAAGLSNTWYSTNAIANSPYKIIAVTQQTEAVAGTYATAPSLVQPVGGEAYTSLGKFQTIIGAAVATTSGTSFLFSGIPAWAKRVKLLLNGVKTASGTGLLVQAGSGGAVQTAGYFAGSAGVSTGQGSTTSYLNSTAGMCIYCAANTTHVGKMEFENPSGFSWIATHKVYGGVSTQVTEGAGNVTLSGPIDRINLTTIGGADAFTAGSASLIIEG